MFLKFLILISFLMGQNIGKELQDFQEGVSVPETKYFVKFILPDEETRLDVAERLKTEPNISDAADYRRNFSYINEVSFVMDNTDNLLCNPQETGLLDDKNLLIEVEIYCYMDMPFGFENRLKKFGGYIDTKKVKPNFITQDVEITCYSYFGRSEKINGENLTTQYFDNIGLILFNTGLWISNGSNLKNGIHLIETNDNNKARLDDGEWTTLIHAASTLLKNKTQDQSVWITHSSFDLKANQTSTVIVKNEGEQYPETFFFYGNGLEIVKRCFELMGVEQMQIDNIEIPSYDGRNCISFMPSFPGQNFLGNCLSIVSNGIDKIWISIQTSNGFGANLNYEIWEINLTARTFVKKYEDDSAYGDVVYARKLELSPNGAKLYAFYAAPTGTGRVQLFSTEDYSRLNFDIPTAAYNYTRIEYSKVLDIFLFVGQDISTGSKHIYIFGLDLNMPEPGPELQVLKSNNDFRQDGAQVFFEKDGIVSFYFIKNQADLRKLCRIQYVSGAWTDVQVLTNFVDNLDISYMAMPHVAEGKILFYKITTNKAYLYDTLSNTFSGNIAPENCVFYSPFEPPSDRANAPLNVIVVDFVEHTERLGKISNGVLKYETEIIEDFVIAEASPQFARIKRMCMIKDSQNRNVILIATYNCGLLVRYANTFLPTIFGEYNTTGITLRDVLQDAAKNYLAYIKVDVNKKGYFVKRNNYKNESEVELKKLYVKDRTKEDMYNEKYGRVVINGRGRWGSEDVDELELSESLDMIPKDFEKDFAKYFHEYYSVQRSLMTVVYIPTFYNLESLDKAILTDFGIDKPARIHTVSPRKTQLELQILIDG